MRLRTTLLPIILLLGYYGQAQVSDDFSDGNFNSGYVWVGNTDDFEVDGSNRLHLNATAATAESYLSIANQFVEETTWEFYVEFDFNPSGSNQLFIYLVSNEEDLSGDLNGYFVRMGHSSDEISLYRQDGGVTTEIIDGEDDVLDVSASAISVKVTRDANGNWELMRDLAGGNSYTSEGTVSDVTYTNTSYFGFLCDYTSTRSTLFWMDNVRIYATLTIDSTFASSNEHIQVQFNQNVTKASSELISNYRLEDAESNLITIDEISRDETDQSLVELATSGLVTSDYTLTLNGVEDSIATLPVSGLTTSFAYKQLELNEVLTLSELQVQLLFNDTLDEASAQEVGNYFINQGIGQPQSATWDSADPTRVNLILSNSLFESAGFELTVSGLSNHLQNSVYSASKNFTFVIPLVMETIEAISSTTCVVTFNKTLNQSIAETLTNYSMDGAIGSPTSAILLSDHVSVELTFSTPFGDDSYALTVNHLEDEDGQVIAAGSTVLFDYLHLEITSITQVDERSLQVTFNQSVLESGAETTSHYSLSEIGTPVDAERSEVDLAMVTLTWAALYNSSYELIITGLTNVSGNSAPDSLVGNIIVSTPTTARQLIINEFLADPTPSVGLPEVEYVEVFNPSTHSIELEGFTLDGQTIEPYRLESNSYVVLADQSSLSDFGISNVAGVQSMGALTNASDVIVLRDQFDNVVDSISYNASEWFADTDKDNGGYSLELINPFQPCSDGNNWSGSTNANGGTPGLQNSVFIDTDEIAPKLEAVAVVGGDSLWLSFSEPIDETTLSLASFSLEGFSFSSFDQVSFSQYYLITNTELTSENTYELTIENVFDCLGNELTSQSFSFYHDVKGPVLEYLALVSDHEIALVFDEPLNEQEAEDESNYSANGLELVRANVMDSASNRVQLLFDESLVLDEEYVLSYQGMEDTLKNSSAPNASSFFYSTIVDSCWVETANVLVLQIDEDVPLLGMAHTNFLSDDLEVRPVALAGDKVEPNRYRLSFAQNFDANQEHTLYINDLFDADDHSRLPTPAIRFTYDTRAPAIDEILVQNDSQVVVAFNEVVTESTAGLSANYALQNGEQPYQVEPVSDVKFKLTFANKFSGHYTISIQGIEDVYGNRMSSTRRVDFIYDVTPPVVLDAYQIAPSNIEVVFDEPLGASALITDRYALNGELPEESSIIRPDSTNVALTFEVVDAALSASLVISNVEDVYGNALASQVLSLNTLQPRIVNVSAWTDTSVVVIFSQQVEGGAVAINYSLEGYEVTWVNELGATSYELFVSESFLDGDSLHLTIKDVLGLNNEELQAASLQTTFQVRLEDFGLINEQTLYLNFEQELSALSPANFQLSGHTIALASLDNEDGSLVRITLGEPLAADVATTLSWNGLSDRYTRSIPDYQVMMINDKTPPDLVDLRSDFFGTLQLAYGEPMDLAGLESINKYTIIGIGNPVSVIVMNDSTVLLDFDDQLADGASYALVSFPIADRNENLSMQDTILFTYSPPALPGIGDIVFTEIMADPTPAVELPEVEYVELYNLSNQAINLKGLVFEDESSQLGLPDYELEAEAYVVILPEGLQDRFELENVIALEGFPSLTNSGERLLIKSVYGDLIDSVSYNSGWYGDGDKDEGGYALERISFAGSCSEEQNWSASAATKGGTPGYTNSVFRSGTDGTAPAIELITKLSPKEISITFNEAMDSLSLIQSVFLIANYPVQNRLVSGEQHEVWTVQLRDSLSIGEFYSAAILGPLDCTGTPMKDTTVVFAFGRDPMPGELLISEIMADPEPSSGLPPYEYVELYNNTSELLSLEHVTFSDNTSSRLLGDYVLEDSSYVVLTSEEAVDSLAAYGAVLALADWPVLTNSGETLSLAIADLTIDGVPYDSDWFDDPEQKEGGHSLEMINPIADCPGSANWTGSLDALGGTPGFQNSVYNLGPDDTKPVVIAFEVLERQRLRFTFSEAMDSLSLLSADVQGVIAMERSVSGEEHTQLIIELLQPLRADEVTTITLSKVNDCSGNEIEAVAFNVAIGRAPTYNELVISEIMSDPEPAVGLPVSEYLELYNRSASVLSLDGVRLIDQSDTVELPAITLLPKRYALLTPTARVQDFEDDIQVIGVPGWLTLNNGGEQLILESDGELVFYIDYDVSWHSAMAQSGGVSLEMKDNENPCGGQENWASSIAAAGGTPGLSNSVTTAVPDNFGPKLVAAHALNDQLIELVFDELLGANSPSNTALIFEPSLVVQKITFGDSRKSLFVYLEQPLVVNELVEVEVFGTVDCLGNSIRLNTASLVLPDTGTKGEVVINELLFNPRSEGVDFIELLNRSSKYIDLFGWQLGRHLEDGSLESHSIAIHHILAPNEPVAISEDTTITNSQYPFGVKNLLQQTSIPTMPNTEGNVLVFNELEVMVDTFAYDEGYHLAFIEDKEGVSLERIDPVQPSQDPNNWTSASSAVGYATPGYTNSQSFDVPTSSAKVSIEPKVFVPGNRSVAHQSFTTINYQLNQTGQFANITIYNQMGQPVADLGRGVSLGTSGFFRWDGTSYTGSMVRRGYYVVLFELYDGVGNSQQLKETVVVGK